MTQRGYDPYFALQMIDMRTLPGKSFCPEYSVCTTLGYEKLYEMIAAFDLKIFILFCAFDRRLAYWYARYSLKFESNALLFVTYLSRGLLFTSVPVFSFTAVSQTIQNCSSTRQSIPFLFSPPSTVSQRSGSIFLERAII